MANLNRNFKPIFTTSGTTFTKITARFVLRVIITCQLQSGIYGRARAEPGSGAGQRNDDVDITTAATQLKLLLLVLDWLRGTKKINKFDKRGKHLIGALRSIGHGSALLSKLGKSMQKEANPCLACTFHFDRSSCHRVGSEGRKMAIWSSLARSAQVSAQFSGLLKNPVLLQASKNGKFECSTIDYCCCSISSG